MPGCEAAGRPANQGRRHAGGARRAVAIASLVAGLGLAAGAAQASPASGPVSIIGGTPARVGAFPSVVAILIDSSLCTGTLIAPTWVLTAGHCVDPDVLAMPSQAAVTAATKVHFGTVDVLQDPGTVVDAIATFKDPAFTKTRLGSNDLGLIQLGKAVTDVVPSAINLAANAVPVGTTVTTVGFGATQTGGGGGTGVEFSLAGRTSTACGDLGIGSDANLLCFSQANMMGTCQGDSGGPSFAMIGGRQTVVGATSFGDQQCAMFSASTRVDVEQPFLVMHVPELIGCLGDKDCPNHRTCFEHRCIVQPFSPTGIGSVCASPTECESAQCAESSQDGKRCSMTCSVSDGTSCPDGFECLRATGDVGACWPAVNTGCCAAGGAGGPQALMLALVTASVVRRRRRDMPRPRCRSAQPTKS